MVYINKGIFVMVAESCIKTILFNVTVLFRVLKCEYVHQDLLPSFLSCLWVPAYLEVGYWLLNVG